MKKHEFIAEISVPLKKGGYKKRGSYWYKQCNDLIFCINVQGSQWDKDDYYVEIGCAFVQNGCPMPTLLHWNFRHRCEGKKGELNILPDEFFACLEDTFLGLESAVQIPSYLNTKKAVKIVNQYWF